MIAERDRAGFVLPFTFGLAVTTALQQVNSDIIIYTVSVSFLLISVCLYTLSLSRHKQLSSSLIWACIIVLGICCGALCCDTDWHNLTSTQTNKFWLYELAADFGQKTKIEIASVPFKNDQTNSIAKALITGDKGGLSAETIGIFRKSGASHILALSGMHLGIIYGLLKILFWGLGGSPAAKRIKSCLNIIICGFYTLSTGAAPSIVRAFLFISIAEVATLSNRKSSLKTTLFSALLIQLIITPEEITNVGFQLSYAAITGIAFIYPKLQKMWPYEKKSKGLIIKALRWIWNCSALSIACQITTAPIAYAYFGTFPKYFLITNILAIPLIGLIIPLILLTLILSSWGICPDFVTLATEKLINGLVYSLEVISSL